MIVTLSLCIVFILFVVLFSKFIGVQRKIDRRGEEDNVSRELYVTPAVDKEITEQMKALQQMYIPVQYIDNGLMPKITESLSSVEKVLKPRAYDGPGGLLKENYSSSSFEQAKFTDALKDFHPHVPHAPSEAPETTNEIEPFNSLFGMIASQGQNVTLVDPE